MPLVTGARRLGTALATLALLALSAAAALPAQEASVAAARLPVEELTLANGMRFLLVERPQSSTISAGWVARVGSADERSGETGLSHFIEHLLFKGSRTVSARQIDRELELLGDLDRVAIEIARLEARSSSAGKRSAKAERKLIDLRQRFSELQEQAREVAFLGELSLLYSRAGATGLNANTLEDLTMFYVTVPAEKLELWFWLESDRLLQPVFREFYKEKRVVREERRLRIESTPTGSLDAQYRGRFWGELPYSWLPLGSQSDIDATTRANVRSFFSRHYHAGNLTAVLVGNFDRRRVAELAARYFGRLSGSSEGSAAPAAFPPVAAPGAPLVASCDCSPQLQLRYPTVPFRHPDSYRLQVLAGVLNGRTGRLYRSLVLGSGLAYSASVLQHPLRRSGSFLFSGEARGATDPETLRPAWQRQVEQLATQPVPASELAKVKNQITADAYRRLQDSTALMQQLLIYDGLGEWRHINDWPERILRVTGPEIGDVARRYLAEGRPAVAIYRRETGSRPGRP